MKQYLLGTLPDQEASAVEELYFTNPPVFNRIREARIELICAYLDGALQQEEQAQFEKRFLQIPALRQLVDQVRAGRAIRSPHPPRLSVMRLSVAAMFIGAAILGLLLFRPGQPTRQQAAGQHPPAGISLFLEPGVTMGPSSQAKLLMLPLSAAPISITAELPGEKSSADYIARLKRVDSDRTQPAVWSSKPTRSELRSGGRQVTVTLDSSMLSPGDYILELALPGGPIRETYVFRAVAASR